MRESGAGMAAPAAIGWRGALFRIHRLPSSQHAGFLEKQEVKDAN
jgi:hypothetical protein